MQRPAVSIREATEDDIPTILRFIRELAEYERAPDAVTATPDLLRQHLFGRGIGRGPVAEAWIAESLPGIPPGMATAVAPPATVPEGSRAAIGFAVFFMNFSTWLGKPGLYLEDLYVTPAWRGRGAGRMILQKLAKTAVERGCGRMEWSVLDWNEPALQVYRAIGAEGMTEWTVHRLAGESLQRLAALA